LLRDSTTAAYIRLQKYFLSIGASYILISDLNAAQRGPVLMNVGPKSFFASANVWLLIPWDIETGISLPQWIHGFFQQSRLQPNLTLVITSSPMDEADARQLKREVGRRLGICRADEKRVFGDPQAERKLEHLFDPSYAPKFETIDLE